MWSKQGRIHYTQKNPKCSYSAADPNHRVATTTGRVEVVQRTTACEGGAVTPPPGLYLSVSALCSFLRRVTHSRVPLRD